MDETAVIQIIAIIILIVLSNYFSGTETAFSSVSRARLKNLSNSGDKRAGRSLRIVDDFDRALSALLIGNNIVNIASASIATLLFTQMARCVRRRCFYRCADGYCFDLRRGFAEVARQNQNPEDRAMRSSGVLAFCMKLFAPIIWCLQKIVKLLSGKEKNCAAERDGGRA